MSPVFGRGCPAREPRDYRGRMCVFSVYYFILASLSSIREDTLERTRVRLESSRASTRKSYAVPDIPGVLPLKAVGWDSISLDDHGHGGKPQRPVAWPRRRKGSHHRPERGRS